MIVTCPSCSTRYRHADEAGAMVRVRCGRCDSRFFVSAPKRSYVMTAGDGAPARVGGERKLSIGMDDPGLADRIRETALDAGGDRREPMVYRVMADDSDGADEVVLSEAAAAPARGRRRAPLHAAVWLATTAGGAALGYHYPFTFDFEVSGVAIPLGPVPMAAAAGGIGLVVGWIWFRWATRKR